jgi:hypothetical protein
VAPIAYTPTAAAGSDATTINQRDPPRLAADRTNTKVDPVKAASDEEHKEAGCEQQEPHEQNAKAKSVQRLSHPAPEQLPKNVRRQGA